MRNVLPNFGLEIYTPILRRTCHVNAGNLQHLFRDKHACKLQKVRKVSTWSLIFCTLHSINHVWLGPVYHGFLVDIFPELMVCVFSEQNSLMHQAGSYLILFFSFVSCRLVKYFTGMVDGMEQQRGLIFLFKSVSYIAEESENLLCYGSHWYRRYASTNM
jgi:hypothetical protein